jgi:Tfp pilus assembly protein PilV
MASDAYRSARRLCLPLKRDRGFALLITLTLLAFAVLLLVGLAAYTRVETAVAGNTQRQAQARENALVALHAALGELQRHAGTDTVVTATASALPGVDPQKRFYTGVWSSNLTATASAVTPLAWLASGAADAGTFDPTAPLPAASVSLVGSRTDGSSTAQATSAALVDITAPGVPGFPSPQTVIGRYAWWVGDQGVKAPVAVPDSIDAIDYLPFVNGGGTDGQARIRQQIGLGAAAASSNGTPVFDPRDAANKPAVTAGRIVAPNQFALLRTAASAAATVGLGPVRQNFHAWSPNNFAVIADTVRGGLRQDLSLDPNLLGSGFAAWANYSAYMEPPVNSAETADGEGQPAASSSPAISPAYGSDPLRRRYRIKPAGGTDEPGVAPVLSFFYLYFGVNKPNAGAPFTMSLRWAVGLWNPYTSALVPEDLRLEIEGLPADVFVRNAATNSVEARFSPPQEFGRPLVISLPWTPSDPSAEPDKQSWLPGRVFNWTVEPGGAVNGGAYVSRFDSADQVSFADGVLATKPGSPLFNSNSKLTLSVPDQVTLRVRMVRAADGAVLAEFTSPDYDSVAVTNETEGGATPIHFGYLFRLKESIDSPSSPSDWLLKAEQDLRGPRLGSGAFVAVPDGPNPAAYTSYRVYEPQRLLDRAKSSRSFNEDVSLFELPRAPILSLGQLQHFPVPNAQHFSIGNPWGGTATLNNIPVGELFDRFFFSGLVGGVTPRTNAAGDIVLPNPLLKPVRKQDGSKVSVDDLTALMAPPSTTDPDGNVVPGPPASSRSSKFLLQAGAFNLNSTEAAAWASVLRRVRFTDGEAFRYLAASTDSGTAADSEVGTVQSPAAHFLRFSQSAQETYQASGDGDESVARTINFRRGVRVLSDAQVGALAARIAELVRTKHAATEAGAGGPFRSLSEFLAPSGLFAGADSAGNPLAPRSLLEAAIADANINVDENGALLEFSSQFLTQADIMTALAPTLFPRSDTFVIRAYGEAVNPAKAGEANRGVEGRAWCEAVVQRYPDYVEPAADDAAVLPENLTSELNKRYGRRFKVVSFRWLTALDI